MVEHFGTLIDEFGLTQPCGKRLAPMRTVKMRQVLLKPLKRLRKVLSLTPLQVPESALMEILEAVREFAAYLKK